MKSFNKLIFPCLVLAHVIIRLGLSDLQMPVEQSPEQLICSFEDQLAEQSIQAREAVLAIVE